MRSAHKRFLDAIYEYPEGRLFKASFQLHTLVQFAQSIGCQVNDVEITYGIRIEIDATLPPGVAELRNADRSIVHTFYLEGAG